MARHRGWRDTLQLSCSDALVPRFRHYRWDGGRGLGVRSRELGVTSFEAGGGVAKKIAALTGESLHAAEVFGQVTEFQGGRVGELMLERDGQSFLVPFEADQQIDEHLRLLA